METQKQLPLEVDLAAFLGTTALTRADIEPPPCSGWWAVSATPTGDKSLRRYYDADDKTWSWAVCSANDDDETEERKRYLYRGELSELWWCGLCAKPPGEMLPAPDPVAERARARVAKRRERKVRI